MALLPSDTAITGNHVVRHIWGFIIFVNPDSIFEFSVKAPLLSAAHISKNGLWFKQLSNEWNSADRCKELVSCHELKIIKTFGQ